MLTWNAFYALLLLYRCFFSVLGQTLILRLTAIPDTTGYQQYTLTHLRDAFGSGEAGLVLGFAMQQNADWGTRLVAAAFNALTGGNAILINIGFQTIAFLGIVYLLRGVEPVVRRPLAILVMFPSFTVWSSIASKEALVVAIVCVVARYVVDLHYGRERFAVFHLGTLLLVYVFKPHFVPAMAYVVGVAWCARAVRQPATLALTAGAASLATLYLLRDPVDKFGRQLVRWTFLEPGGSSRGEPFLQDPFDMFAKAPEGMFRSFMGPTFAEAGDKVLHLVSYAESALILVVLAVLLLWRLPRIPVYGFLVGLFTLFWILFATYPLGVSNPGTAVRYRTDFIIIVFLAVVILTSRNVFVAMRTQSRMRRRVARSQRAEGPALRPAWASAGVTPQPSGALP